MMSYKIALFLFIFGLVGGVIAEYNVFLIAPPSTIAPSITEQDAQEVGQGAAALGASPLYFPLILIQLGGILLKALVFVFCVLPLLLGLGIPLAIGMIIQAPIWLVYVYDMFQLWTGHSMGMAD